MPVLSLNDKRLDTIASFQALDAAEIASPIPTHSMQAIPGPDPMPKS